MDVNFDVRFLQWLFIDLLANNTHTLNLFGAFHIISRRN